MTTKFGSFCILLVLFAGLHQASAQNAVFTYQGQVLDNGTNFAGAGQFKFALITSTNLSSQAAATATISGGFLTIVTVTSRGAGYVTAPAVTASGGGGSNAVLTAMISSAGVVTNVAVDNPGDGYTSTPTIIIAAPPANILTTTYWSNDGTSSAGSQPTTAVDLGVANGLFAVRLGDTTLANMTAISAALFEQPNLELQIWFSDGVNGFAALNPAQPLTPVPYAITANSAGTANSASNLLGPIPAASLSGTYASPVTLNNANNSFTGNGGGLTSLNAANLTGSNALPAGVLPTNVALLNSNQTFTGVNIFNSNVGLGIAAPFSPDIS
jgi:hypothetical protein